MINWLKRLLERLSPHYRWYLWKLSQSCRAPTFKERPHKIWGHLRLEWHNGRTGESGIVEDSNVVVDQGRVHILQRLSPALDATKDAVTAMEAGDGGCGVLPPTSALFTPVPFTISNTALRASINYIATNDPSPAVNGPSKTITFVCFLSSSSTTNGQFHYTPRVINELGLRTGDGTIIALRSFRSIPFDPADSVVVKATWTLGIV